MPDKGKGRIESPLTPFKTVTSYTEAPGSYTKHPNVGPAGVDGGLPLKFTDESIKGTMPEGPSMEPTPAKAEKA
jgi:hypothetical protein